MLLIIHIHGLILLILDIHIQFRYTKNEVYVKTVYLIFVHKFRAKKRGKKKKKNRS